MYVYNGKYNGPPSNLLTFDTPEGEPDPVPFLEAHPLGSSSFLLQWKKPERPNGILTGYKIYYAEVENTSVGKMIERHRQITDPNQLRAKLSGLKTGAKYRLYITARTARGEGKPYFIERVMRSAIPTIPTKPNFTWQRLRTEGPLATIRVFWLPNLENKPGSHFFVQYR